MIPPRRGRPGLVQWRHERLGVGVFLEWWWPFSLAGRLADRGIDWDPFEEGEIRGGVMCGADDQTGRWWCQDYLDIDAGALWRLGLHPDLSRCPGSSAAPLPPSHVKKILAERLALEAWQ